MHAVQTYTSAVMSEVKQKKYKWQIVWRNVAILVYLHISSLYGLYLIVSGNVKIQTVIFCYFLTALSSVGITAGAHRLWAHKAYKARWPLRFCLMLMQTLAYQNHVYEWVRDHRVHHKYTETDADPHNSRRGFFFSHMGWLMLKKHKDVAEKGATIDMSDLEKDVLVKFQKKNYMILMPIICFVIPTWIPVNFWNESLWNSWNVAAVFRYTFSLHCTWLVNSAAHMWGNKPYDTNIYATENIMVAILAYGEGWHNYHHVFPWDYKAAELGNYRANLTTALIDLAYKLGLAYELKTVKVEMIRKRKARTGDKSQSRPNIIDCEVDHSLPDNPVWGWGDEQMTEEEKEVADISH